MKVYQLFLFLLGTILVNGQASVPSLPDDVEFIKCFIMTATKILVMKQIKAPAMWPEISNEMMTAGGTVPENFTDTCTEKWEPTAGAMRTAANDCQIMTKSELPLIFTGMSKILSEACTKPEESFESADKVNSAQPKVPPVVPIVDPLTKKKYLYCEHKKLAWQQIKPKMSSLKEGFEKTLFNIEANLAYELTYQSMFGTGFKTIKTCEES